MVDESGQVTVEYAVIAAAMAVVLAAAIGLARAPAFGGWMEKTKRAFLVSGGPDTPKSIMLEIQER